MKTRFAPAIFAVLFLAVAAESQSEVTLRFSVSPAHTLQAIPASFTLRVDNASDAAIVLPPHVLLRVFAPDHEAFIATFGLSQERPFSRAVLARDDAPVRLAPHERRTFTFAAATLDNAPGWFVDPRMGAPGTYRLQMLLADRVSDEAISRVPATEVESVCRSG